MSVPSVVPMYIINASVAWFIVVLCIGAYIYIRARTGQDWAFWLITAGSWTMFAVSHSFVLAGVDTSSWYMTTLRIGGYVVQIAALIHLIADKLVKFKQLTRLHTLSERVKKL